MILQGQSVPQMVPGGGTGSSVVQTTSNGLYPQVGFPNQMMHNPGQDNLGHGGQMISPNQNVMTGMPMNPMGPTGRPRMMQNGVIQNQPLNNPVPVAPTRAKRPRAPKNSGGRANRTPRSKAAQQQQQQQQMMQQHLINSNNPNMHLNPNSNNGNNYPNSMQHPQQQQQQQQSLNNNNSNNNFFNQPNDFETWQQQQMMNLNNHSNNRLANTPPAMLPGSPNMILYSNLRRMPSHQAQGQGAPLPPQMNSGPGNPNAGNVNNNPTNIQNNRLMNPNSQYFHQTQMLLQNNNNNNNNQSNPPSNNHSGNHPQSQSMILNQNLPASHNQHAPLSSSSDPPMMNKFHPSRNNLQQNNFHGSVNKNNCDNLPLQNSNNINWSSNPATATSATTSSSSSSAATSAVSNQLPLHMMNQQSLMSPSNTIPGPGGLPLNNSNVSNHPSQHSNVTMRNNSNSFINSPLPNSNVQYQNSNLLLKQHEMNNPPSSASTPTFDYSGQYQNNRSITPRMDSMTPDAMMPSNSPFSGQQSRPLSRANSFQDASCIVINPNDTIVSPITNGLVWGPSQINLDDIITKALPNGIYVQTFEFDLSSNHLNTIINRSDLDIAISCHFHNEPIQLCQWPAENIQIRFNDTNLLLDRSIVVRGKPAHKVACIKQLCRSGTNVIEICVTKLGDDPNNQQIAMRRRLAVSNLKPFKFVAFMAHMPALNLLLEGLQRRHSFELARFVDIIAKQQQMLNPQQNGKKSVHTVMVPLICPITKQRIRIPGRTVDCQHIDTFDMEAFLKKEVLWPRLCCPICGRSSPSGLDGLCIDLTVQFALNTLPAHVESVLVNTDGHWSLPSQYQLNLSSYDPPTHPIIGPMTRTVHMAVSVLSNEKFDEYSECPNPGSNNPSFPNGIDKQKSEPYDPSLNNNMGPNNGLSRQQSQPESNQLYDQQDSTPNPAINLAAITKISLDEYTKGITINKNDYIGIPKELINFAAANTFYIDPFLQSDYLAFIDEYL